MPWRLRLRVLLPVAAAAFPLAWLVALVAAWLLALSGRVGIVGSGGTALLVAAAVIGLVVLGGAGLWHAAVLFRLLRVRPVDGWIVAVGVAAVVAGLGLAVASRQSQEAVVLLLAVVAPLWGLGLAVVVLAGAVFLFLRVSPGDFLRVSPSDDVPGVVLVLGAGLRGRQVGPLLRRRVELGAALWHEAAASGRAVRMIVAGGQGRDEVRSEASAMAEHLVRHLGVPAEAIALEERSTSTRENLVLSSALIGPEQAGSLLVVTSDYHVLRTAGLLAALGLAGSVRGARSRASYLPGALVREVLAMLAAAPWWSIAAAAAGWALAVLLLA